MFESITPLFFGLPGGPELLVVLLLVVLLFGADRLPKLARSSGQAMGEFQKGREAVEAEIRGARDRTLVADGTSGETQAAAAGRPDEAVDTEPRTNAEPARTDADSA